MGRKGAQQGKEQEKGKSETKTRQNLSQVNGNDVTHGRREWGSKRREREAQWGRSYE